MKFRYSVPASQIHVFSFILESYEDVGVITTESSSGENSVVLATVADDYACLFRRIVDSLIEEGLSISLLEEMS